MSGYESIILLMKYGFAVVLLLTGSYGAFETWRRTRRRGPTAEESPRLLVRLLRSMPFLLSAALMGVAVILLLADHTSHYEFLNIVKIISGIFTLVYGIYATLSDFYEDNAEGRRVITKVGLIGIMLFFSSTLLSISADYVKNSIEKRNIEERRKYYANIVDKLVVVDKRSGRLNVNFRKFSDGLFAESRRVRQQNADLQARLAAALARVDTLTKNGERDRLLAERSGVARLRLERALAAEQGAHKAARADLTTARAAESKLRTGLGQTRSALAVMTNREGEARAALAHREKELKRIQLSERKLSARVATIPGLQSRLAAKGAELVRVTAKLTDAQEALGRSTQEAGTMKERLRASGVESRRLRRALAGAHREHARQIAGLTRELSALRTLLERKPKPTGKPSSGPRAP